MDAAKPVPIFRRFVFQWGLIVFVMAVLLYAKTGSFGYAWDDAIVITENPRVQQGFAHLGSHWELHNSGTLADQNGYRPVVMTSFAFEYGLFGANPGISHLLNAVFYGILCWLVFVVLTRLFPGKGLGFHFLISLVFTMHPLHVEAVANIKSRDEIFSMAFSMVSLLLLLRFYEHRKPLALLGSLLAFAFAFLSKESALAFLAVMGVTILMQQGTMRKKLDCTVAIACPVDRCLLVDQLGREWATECDNRRIHRHLHRRQKPQQSHVCRRQYGAVYSHRDCNYAEVCEAVPVSVAPGLLFRIRPNSLGRLDKSLGVGVIGRLWPLVGSRDWILEARQSACLRLGGFCCLHGDLRTFPAGPVRFDGGSFYACAFPRPLLDAGLVDCQINPF
ncbi:MAG: glycosyltransferase family 39 protein [Bacteroidetes bacterium]|nr:glycosyltransferase family 39 protein [Bacteroidota bacterium]